jgi:hypothetical protein
MELSHAAELHSLRGLSRGLQQLFDTRDATGDLTFAFDGEEAVKAHRYGPS